MNMNNRSNNNQDIRNRPLGYDHNIQDSYMNYGNRGGNQPYQNNYQQQQSYNQQSSQYYQQPQQQDVLCNLSLVLSIISVLCCSPLAVPAIIIAVISIVKTPYQSKKTQITAIIISVISLILFTVLLTINSNETKEDKIVWQPTINEKVENESSKPEEKISEPATATVDDENNGATTGEKNALRSAKSYLSYLSFSRDGLIHQLEYEGFTDEQAIYGADNCGADWNEQAAKSARSYLSYLSFSRDGLINQLEYEGFTNEQAVYGVDNCEADWNEQAAKSARSYLSYLSFSRDGLINQLEYEGFTYEQAVYGVEQNGY